jgi:hypothetical protein
VRAYWLGLGVGSMMNKYESADLQRERDEQEQKKEQEKSNDKTTNK